jgi:hypothetical protein
MLDPSISGQAHYDAPKLQPFTIGQVDSSKGFVHVLDDTSLDIVLGTLDTINDFVDYLTKKETLIRSGRLGGAAGEEELLAYYLMNLNHDEEHDFVLPEEVTTMFIDEGHWETFINSPQRHAQLKENEISYAWDTLIETFSKYIIEGTQYYSSHGEISYSEKIVRFLAREPRTRRRMLAQALMGIIDSDLLEWGRNTRLVLPTSPEDSCYIFLILSHPSEVSVEEYREVRRVFLEECCRVLKAMRPETLDIVGIATEGRNVRERSEDAIYFDAREWTSEDQGNALKMQQELGIFQNMRGFSARVQEYPDAQSPSQYTGALLTPLRMRGRDRNSQCPCGNGNKYKKCCGRLIS